MPLGSLHTILSATARANGNGCRLGVWYLILTIAFRCPQSSELLDGSSPRACVAYFEARERFAPVLQPYYQTYAAPYVDSFRPHFDSLHANIYLPASAAYTTYAHPHVTRARTVGQQQWDKFLKPQLDQASARASELYDASLAPHVATAHGALKPHLDKVAELGAAQYDMVVLPALTAAQPYVQQAYDQSYAFTTQVGLPYASWAANSATVFVQRQVWPPIRVLYGENIQPQLAKIAERLSSYKDGKRLETMVEVADADLSRSSSSSSLVSKSSQETAAQSSVIETASTVTPAAREPTKISAKEIEDYAGELKAWKEKFAKAAERGAHDLRNRISDITDKQMEQQVKGTGEALLTSLDEVTTVVLEQLKGKIVTVINDIPTEDEAPTDDGVETAKDLAHVEIRDTGKRIREAAQRVRGWRSKFNKDTEDLVNAATESTLEVVNNIRDLGLQEIGMRWATLDGVSYKDWSEYHELRKTFADWRKTVQDVVDEHQGPKLVNVAGEDIESRGMVIAENAARELARLKDVSMWKVEAHDKGDDFSTRYSPPGVARVERAAKRAAERAKDAVVGDDETSTSSGVAESLSAYAEPVAAAVSSKASSVAEAVSEAASSASDAASSSTVSASSAASEAASSASSKASSASKSVQKPSSSSISSAASSAVSSASSAGSSALDDVSSAISDASSVVAASGGSAVDAASSAAASVVSAASSSYDSAQSSKARESSKSRVRSSGSSFASGASSAVASGAAAASSAASSRASKASEKSEM